MSLAAVDPGEIFEHFANYCIVARDFPSITDYTEIVFGGNEDTGLDGAAIFVNGIYIESVETLNFIADKTRIAVDFIFIQSKSSRKVSANEVGGFGEGVFSFFSDTGMRESERITQMKAIKDAVFKRSARFSDKPRVVMFFCTASNFNGDVNIDARANSVCNRLQTLNFFSEVRFDFVNKDRLTTRYDEIRLKIEREIIFDRHAVFPEIAGIRQAYIGLLSCRELLKMICNSDGELQRNIFSENIRDFLGDNKVNGEIAQTVRSKIGQLKLPALNNGITIVAKEISSVGNKFTVRDYQIVNGCQTSNVIFNHRDVIDRDAFVPVRIIEVMDSELVNEIVKSTNRQTQITDEAFVVLGDFHKQLERFFQSMNPPKHAKIYYERRRNQYQDLNISFKQVISLTALTKSFLSVFCGEPHSTIRYYGELIEANQERLFREKHSLWPYYTASAIFFAVDRYLEEKQNKRMRQYKYQICFLYLFHFGPFPDFSADKKMSSCCQKVLDTVWDPKIFNNKMQACDYLVDQELRNYATDNTRNPPFRLREFTKAIEFAAQSDKRFRSES